MSLTITPALRRLIRRAKQLQDIPDLLTFQEMCDLVGIPGNDTWAGRKARLRLWLALSNYSYNGVAEWPPTQEGALRRFVLPAGPPPPCVTGWPDHAGVPPPPAVPDPDIPLWTTGQVYRWAMNSGRMSLDGTVLQAARGGSSPIAVPSPPKPDLANVDLDRWRELTGDTTLCDVNELADLIGMSRATAQHLYRAARNLRAGAASWPPSVREQRTRLSLSATGPVVQDWPDTSGALPPPQGYRDSHSHRRVRAADLRNPAFNPSDTAFESYPWLWTAGRVRLWAMNVGRLTITGEPVPVRTTEETTP